MPEYKIFLQLIALQIFNFSPLFLIGFHLHSEGSRWHNLHDYIFTLKVEKDNFSLISVSNKESKACREPIEMQMVPFFFSNYTVP